LSPSPANPADRFGQLYRAQSLINEAVARATDFKTLCEQVCCIGVEEGGIACVLVRLHDAATDLLTTVAFSGPHTGFIGRPQLPAHDSKGVSAIAFQTKQRAIVDDMRASPITSHVAFEVAKQWGINSAAAFPLLSNGKPIGTFAMFAEGTGFFDAELADLLEHTAAILAFSHEKLFAEAARLQAEERLRLAMTASQSGVWDWDLKTGKAFLSDEYYRMFGYEPGEVEGNLDTLLGLVHPDNRDKTHALLKQQWESGVAATDYEQRFVCKDGSVKWVQIRAKILRDAQGRAERMVGTTIDLTERKEREQRILQLSRLNAALGKINAAVARVADFPTLAADACRIAVEDGGFVSAVIRTMDAEKAHLTQVADFGVRGGFLGLGTIPLAESRGVTALAFRQGQPVIVHDLKSDPVTRHAAADGKQIGINAGAAFPLSAGGVMLGTMTVWAANERFIDEQNLGLLQQMVDAVAFAHAKLAADAAVATRERDMKLAQQAGNIGSVIIDLQAGKWTTSEVGFAVLGLPPADWYPLAAYEAMLAPERRAEEMAIMRANIASGKPSRQDYEIIRPADSRRRWLRVITDSEFDSTGKAVRRIGTLQDVTEEHLAKQRVERANRLYAALSKTNEAVARSSDFETLAASVCTIAVEHGGLATAVIRLHDSAAKGLRRIANAGVRFGAIGSEVLPMEPLDGLAIDAFQHGHPVQASDLTQVQSPLGREAAKAGLTAAVSYPLHDSSDQSIGTFTVFASDLQAFDGETAGLLQEISAALSFAWTKYQADAALLASRRDLEAAQEAGRIGSAIFDVREDTYTLSPVTCQIVGLTEPGPHAVSVLLNMLPAASRKEARDNLSKYRHTTETSDHVYEIEHQLDHQPRWIRLILAGERDQGGEVFRRIGTVQDVTRQYLSERRANLLARLYAALSETNDAIVHAANFAALCRAVCQIVVERGGLVSAAIRLLDDDGKHLVDIAAHGPRAGLLARTSIPVDDTRGVAIVAFHSGKPVLIANMAADPRTVETSAAAAEIGITSAAAFPMLAKGDVFGVFTVWASDSGWIDDQMSTLLAEIAEAVSFARAKLDADARLAASERDLQMAQRAGRVGSISYDVHTGLWTVSEVAVDILGLPSTGPHEMNLFARLLPAAEREQTAALIREAAHSGVPRKLEYNIQRLSDGRACRLRTSMFTDTGQDGTRLRRIATIQDITEEHRATTRIENLSRLYAALSETNAAIVHAADFRGLCGDVARTLVERGGMVAAAVRMPDLSKQALVEVARSGPRRGVLSPAEIGFDATSLTAQAFREKKPGIVHQVDTDARTAHLAAEALQGGSSAAAAFPIILQGEVVATLSIWAVDGTWLDEELAALLTEIADAMAFAHAKLDADARLAANQRDLLMAQRMGRVGSMLHDLRTDMWTVSEVGAEILGLATPGPHDMAQWKALFQADKVDTADTAYATMRANIASNASTTSRYHFRRLTDNQARWLLARVSTECTADGTPLRRIGTIQDVTDEVEARERIERLSRLYAALSKTNEAIVRADSYDALAGEICRILVGEARLVSAVLRLYHPETQALVEVAAHGPRTGKLGRPSVPVDSNEGLAVLAFRHGRRIIVKNLDEHPSTRHSQNDAHANGITAGAAFPLRGNGEPIGTLTLFADRSDAFDDQMADLIGEIADSAAFAHAKMASERARHDADARMAAIIDSAMDALITCDEGLRIVVFNNAAQQMFRITETEAIGQPLNNLLPERFRAEHPRWMKSFGSQSTGSRAMGRLAQVSALRSDGTEFPVEASISHTELSGRRFYTVIMRDVTAKLANQRALAETERRYRGLVETSLSSIMLLRGKVIQYANPATARMLGFDNVADVTGTTVDAVTAPEHLEAVQREIVRLMQQPGQTLDRALLRLLRRDGKLIETLATGTSIDVDGQTLIQLELRDVTRERRALAEVRLLADTLEARVDERTGQLAQANQDLAAANRDLESFSYSVAHDLRAPLRAMIGFSQLLEMDLEEGSYDQLPSHTQRISDSAKRMNELIDGLLAVARVTHGALTETEIDCNVLVGEVINSLSVPESVHLVVEHLPVMKGDVPSMRQVWVNLISNAVKYSAKRPEPHIEVGVVRTETEYWFHVRDNGAGFEPTYADRLFGVFQRLHSQEQFEGTGVGLAIVRRIIERHGGRVWAEGRPNEGATFYFALPLTRMVDA